MKSERFKAVLLEGHKETAVEVPLDPGTRWALPATRLWSGRHGHKVEGKLEGIHFESVVVSRGRSFYLVIGEELRTSAGLAIGSEVQITLHPVVPSASRPPAAAQRRGSPRGTRHPTG